MPAPKDNQYAKGNKGGKGGPSKYKPEFIDIARRLCERGNTDEEIATILGVSDRTLHSWKLQHEEFASALKRTKNEANAIVEASLFKRANGFEREVEKVTSRGKVKVKEYYPPDVAAQRLWLQNRMPQVYREQTEHTHKVDISEKFLKLLNSVQEIAKIEQPAKRQLLIDRLKAMDVEREPID